MSEILFVDDLKQRERNVREGLRFIVRHLDDSVPVWALGRWISVSIKIGPTKKGDPVRKEQIFKQVYSEEQAIAFFKKHNFQDCRIRAYHDPSGKYIRLVPSTLFIDIDMENFETVEEFEACVLKTTANIRERLNVQPTEMRTGNGVHFIIPQFSLPLEEVKMFRGFEKPSIRFMRFEEELLTDGKADPCHMNNVSFGNCMLRIPGSLNLSLLQKQFNEKEEIINIPPEAEVRVTEQWDGTRPSVESLLSEYYIWLQIAVSRELDRRMDQKRGDNSGNGGKIDWVEDVLEMSLGDFRKYAVKFILARYLINIKGLSESESSDILTIWLNNCDLVCRLDFDIDKKIAEALDMVHDYLPKGRLQLEHDFPPFYERLKREGIFY